MAINANHGRPATAADHPARIDQLGKPHRVLLSAVVLPDLDAIPHASMGVLILALSFN